MKIKNLESPMYYQIYNWVKEKINSEEYKEGVIIPSEQELIDLFKVSRITVRRAIEDLMHDGYVSKHRGIGTVVLPRKVNRDMLIFNSLTSAFKDNSSRPESVILEARYIEASYKVRDLLRLKENEQVFWLKRLRLIDGKIIGLHNTFISPKVNFEILPNDFNNKTSLYEYLEQKGVELGSADEVCEAKLATNDLKRDLFLEESVPMLCRERVSLSIDGIPIEYSENSYIAERYKYKIFITKVR